MKRRDLTGQRFGALVALRFVPGAESPTKRAGWMVRCDCGAEKFVDGKNLRRGDITSCGCGLNRVVDLKGQRFGALTALRYIPARETDGHQGGWLVRCDCGQEKVVDGDNLRSGRITSCGCHIERGRRRSAAGNPKAIVDFTGQTFYELTALERVSGGIWRFRCSCGKEIVAKSATVKSGKIQSCGHILSEKAKNKIAKDGGNVMQYFDGTTVAKLRAIMASPEVHGVRKAPRVAQECYTARITVRRKQIYLGHYPSYEAAAAARREAEKKYYLPIIEEWDRLHSKGEQPQKRK